MSPRTAFAMVSLTFLVIAAGGCGGSADGRPRKWSYISPLLIQPNCATANCHSQLAQRSGVALDTVYDGYDQMVNRHFVLPFDAQGSPLIFLMHGQGSRRMPPDYPMADVDITLIEGWIADGALWDGPGSAPPSPTP
jgi:hypothetical protein